MTVHAMLELLPVLIRQRTGGIIPQITEIEPQDGDWLAVRFANGQTLAITVEEVE